RKVCERLRDWIVNLRRAGHAITHLDLGGGFGIDYGDGNYLDFESVATVMHETLQGLDNLQIAIEPGRSIVGNAGVLVSEVIFRKEDDPLPFLILDAGMNDLMRPALYQASHPIQPLLERKVEMEVVNVVGPICESTDFFSKAITLPKIAQGERVALLQAGAYGAVMASIYNSRDIIPEVMVDGDRFETIRRRITNHNLLEFE
ncbi:MAG: diaminopimelate decarboxylase, partial [Sedimenticola sp.]|nr:diaminopimelate decarboxylase [Sedimenticola sp.]